MNFRKKSNLRLYLLTLWMAIVPLTSSALLTIIIYQNENILHSFSSLQWGLLFLIATFTMAFAITPTTYVALVSGYFIGFWGVVPLVIAYQLASVLGFKLAQKMDDGFIEGIITKYPKAATIIQNVAQNQLLLTVLSRLSPALPFALMNVVLSTSKIRLSQFFWGGLIGMLPRSVFFIWVGIQASKLSDAFDNQGNLYLSVIITLVVIVVFYKVLNMKKNKKK